MTQYSYKVTVEVDYIVNASSLSEAMSIVSQYAEYPLIGESNGYCVDDRVIGGAIYEVVANA